MVVTLGWLWFVAVSTLVVTLAVTDWRQRLVANSLVIVLALLAAVFVATGDSEAVVTSRWWAVASAVAAFAVGLGMYTGGLMGAGDVKLLLPVALIMTRVGATSWLFYLGAVIVTAAVVLAVFGRRDRSLPLAPVLGLGVIPALLAAPPPWFAT